MAASAAAASAAAASAAACAPTAGVIGIVRETKSKWERRAPLAPAHVAALVSAGLRVLVQPSSTRVFPDAAYAEAGAEVAEDLSPAALVLGVKEVPVRALLDGGAAGARTYAFFSHTIKAQAAGMGLLDALLSRRLRLLDYECITAGGVRGGRRLVAFGRFAGVAGMVDFLRGLGARCLALGYSTPFLGVAAMYMYPDVAAACAAVRACGEAIAQYGLPDALCPFTAVFTGDGNVSRGAREVFGLLPVTWVDPFALAELRRTATGRARTRAQHRRQCTQSAASRRRAGTAPRMRHSRRPAGSKLVASAPSRARAWRARSSNMQQQ